MTSKNGYVAGNIFESMHVQPNTDASCFLYFCLADGQSNHELREAFYPNGLHWVVNDNPAICVRSDVAHMQPNPALAWFS